MSKEFQAVVIALVLVFALGGLVYHQVLMQNEIFALQNQVTFKERVITVKPVVSPTLTPTATPEAKLKTTLPVMRSVSPSPKG